MSPPEEPPAGASPALPAPDPARYGRYVLVPAIAILIYITIHTLVTPPNGTTGVAPGERVPPFAVPLVLGSLNGEADTAVHAHEGSHGNVPACRERGPQILNICELDEHSPVVLAMFFDAGSCPAILSDMQAASASFPGVRFAAVAIKGSRSPLRRLIAAHHLTFPVGFDTGGVLLALYKMATCPQLTFVLPGGQARGKALLTRLSPAAFGRRIEDLVAAARAAGWRGGSGVGSGR